MQLLHYNCPIEQLGKRYTLIRHLSSGGMADVYLAWDERDHHEAAIKVIRPNVLDPKLLKRFLREGQVVASLDHPHIIHVYGDGVCEETFTNPDPTSASECKVPYIVMEHVKGGDLKKRLEPGQARPLNEIVRIFGQLCEAVQYAHNQGVIHRDIKPANILFREHPQKGDQVVLSDFGLALLTDDTRSSPKVSGTPAYMAPEQWSGKPEFASDIFALGVVLYQLCTGYLPSTLQLPEKPTQLNPNLPAVLDEVILRALSNDPTQRFTSASLFWQAIQSAVKETPLSPIPPSSVVQVPVSLSSEVTVPMNSRHTSSNRNKRAIIIVALVIITLLGFGGWAVLANLVAPTATITITPASKTMQDTDVMHGVTSNANPDNNQVIVRQLTSTRAAKDTATATGYIEISAGVSATGTLTFSSSYPSDYTLGVGTAFYTPNKDAPNKIEIVTDTPVTIPAGSQVSVKAHVVKPNLDTDGNIAAGTIDEPCCVPGTAIRVKNDIFSGGVKPKGYKFLQDSDIEPIKEAHRATLKSDAQNDIQSQKQLYEEFLVNTNCDDAKAPGDDVPLGDQGPAKAVTTAQVTVTVSVSCSAQVYDPHAVQTIAQNVLKQKVAKELGAAYVLAGSILTQTQPQIQQDGSITFQAAAQGIWYYQLTNAMKQALPNMIKGMSKTQAQDTLNKYLGVGNAKIAISYSGDTLPSDVKQIALDVKTVNGLPGGNSPIAILIPTGSGSNFSVFRTISNSNNNC